MATTNAAKDKAPAGKFPTMRIEYCTSWGYLSRAAGLAESLLHDYHDHIRGVTIAPGETGSFEVFLNRKRIFSKMALDRFPEPNEVEKTVEALLAT